MSNKPAFPYSHIFNEGTSREVTESSDGMSLRDYFAAKAMQAMNTNPAYDETDYSAIAVEAYIQADEMMKARGDQ